MVTMICIFHSKIVYYSFIFTFMIVDTKIEIYWSILHPIEVTYIKDKIIPKF